MTTRPIPVIAIVGRSKTGKTTLVERLIGLFRAGGLRVAAIKHHHGDLEMDTPGKDSYRHREAGARPAIISSPGMMALIEKTKGDMPVEEIISRFIDPEEVDVVIIEGYKRSKFPKIEVYAQGSGEGPLCEDDGDILAVVSDAPLSASVPVFSRDDVEGVYRFILSQLNMDSIPSG